MLDDTLRNPRCNLVICFLFCWQIIDLTKVYITVENLSIIPYHNCHIEINLIVERIWDQINDAKC
jgi:hypothetical protein